jgi:serine/threonine protein kinase
MLQAEKILQRRYQLKQQLGQNAGRQTWLAEDLAAQPSRGSASVPAPVIVKLLAFNPQMQWDELKLFEREAQVLKHIKHPKIPQYHDYFSLDEQEGLGLPWFGLVQDYIPGFSLRQLLDEGKRFTEEQASRIATDILKILIYLHELSPPVLHRDIKPSNIILAKNQRCYLVDFGAVQDRAKAEGVTFTVVGTSGYVPPEQLWGKAVPASDLYALGATLIHLLTGTAPADLPQYQMRIDFAGKVSLNSHFTQWLEKLIEPAPEKRFQSAREALEALEKKPSLVAPSEIVGKAAGSRVNYVRLVGLSLLPLGLVSLVSMVLPFFLSSNTKAKQTEAKQYVSAMNRSQQAHFLEKSSFANDLPALELGIRNQTDNYDYSTIATNTAVFNYGISRDRKLKSYVGAVFFMPTLETTQTIICEANSKGLITPAKPIYKNGVIACASGTTNIFK